MEDEGGMTTPTRTPYGNAIRVITPHLVLECPRKLLLTSLWSGVSLPNTQTPCELGVSRGQSEVPMTAPALYSLQQRIHEALFELRCSRHSLDCTCWVGQLNSLHCTSTEKIRQQSLDRLLDRLPRTPEWGSPQ